ncbi:MAG: hypothetical protein JSR43_13840 [Proteobacteria bacterium]|nr:hypothetical protein [Pseudomonadota bacterium]
MKSFGSHPDKRAWVASDVASATVRELQAHGEVSVGMCSGWEFVEL